MTYVSYLRQSLAAPPATELTAPAMAAAANRMGASAGIQT